MLCAHTFFPSDMVDPIIMENTLDKVKQCWQLIFTWGWDFPVMAMTAARLGKPSEAVDLLLLSMPANNYTLNGHNRQEFSLGNLPLYLPGNGGLLLAAALMVKTGFPDGWDVEYEGFKCLEIL